MQTIWKLYWVILFFLYLSLLLGALSISIGSGFFFPFLFVPKSILKMMTVLNSQHTLTSTLHSQLFSLRSTIDFCFKFSYPLKVIFWTTSSLGILYALFPNYNFSNLLFSFSIDKSTDKLYLESKMTAFLSFQRMWGFLSVESITEGGGTGLRYSLPPLWLNHVEALASLDLIGSKMCKHLVVVELENKQWI